MREWIPFSGDRSVRRKISKLEKEAGSLVVIFGVIFSEGVKLAAQGNINKATNMMLISIGVAILYIYNDKIYDDKDEVSDATSEAKEKIEESTGE